MPSLEAVVAMVNEGWNYSDLANMNATDFLALFRAQEDFNRKKAAAARQAQSRNR